MLGGECWGDHTACVEPFVQRACYGFAGRVGPPAPRPHGPLLPSPGRCAVVVPRRTLSWKVGYR